MATTAQDGPEPNSKGRRAKGSLLRRSLTPVLVALACLTFVAGVTGVWARRNFLDSDRFSARSEAIISDPAVKEVLTLRITEQLMQLIDPQAFFEDILPDRGELLAAPLSGAVEDFVRDQVEKFVESDVFERLWIGVSTIAHEASVQLLRGEGGDVVTTAGGEVTINLVPLINGVLAELTSASPEILGREIDIPDISVDEIPSEAIAKLEDVLGVDLDDDYGQVTVYDTDTLAVAQEGISLFDQLVLVMLPASLVIAALALWVSRRRRRTLLQLCFGIALGSVVLRRVSFAIEEEVEALPPTPEGGTAIAAVADVFLSPLATFAMLTIVVVAIIAAVALVTGPYPWAEALRGKTVDRAGDEQRTVWIHDHRDVLLGAGAVVGLVLLWAAELTWLGLLLVVAVIAAYEVVILRMASTPGEDG